MMKRSGQERHQLTRVATQARVTARQGDSLRCTRLVDCKSGRKEESRRERRVEGGASWLAKTAHSSITLASFSHLYSASARTLQSFA